MTDSPLRMPLHAIAGALRVEAGHLRTAAPGGHARSRRIAALEDGAAVIEQVAEMLSAVTRAERDDLALIPIRAAGLLRDIAEAQGHRTPPVNVFGGPTS